MITKKNIYLAFILCIISIILIFAFIIQYGFGHQPCNLCIYQRFPYIISILLIIKVLLSSKNEKIIFLSLSIIFLLSFSLAFYHVGIEQGFFSESFVCENKNLSESLSKEQILKQLKNNSISCKDISFKLLGMSLAKINSIFSLIFSFIFIIFFMNHKKNK